MLEKHHQILVGLDLNSRGDEATMGALRATQQAIWLAKANEGASIRFMHSIYSDDYRTPLSGSPGIVHTGLPEAGEAALAKMVDLARNAGLETELAITEDRPWLDITKMAIRGEIDLVVVGKRNEPEQDGRRLGSSATKLLRKCPCPVWVIKPDHDLEHKNVLAATDLSPVGDDAVRIAATLSKQMQCQLHVVHAWQMPLDLQMKAARIPELEFEAEVQELEQSVRKEILGCLPEEARHGAKIHTAKGKPSDAIHAAIENLNPDLLVMGTLSRRGIAGLLLGSTAERMLHAVDCSVLAIKPEGFESPVKA